jgi:hypothetical protein
MYAGALIRNIETHAVVRSGEINVKQVNASQPTIVMADDGRTFAIDEVGQFVPDPGFSDLDGC